MKTKLPIEKARELLATIWFTGSGLAFLIITIQSILGKYQDQLQDVWSWFIPSVFPTLALMLGVIGAGALQEDTDKRIVKGFFLKLSAVLSCAYLLILLVTMLLEPFSPLRGMSLYSVSNYWLSPLQGLVVAAIAVLFTSQEKPAATPGGR